VGTGCGRGALAHATHARVAPASTSDVTAAAAGAGFDQENSRRSCHHAHGAGAGGATAADAAAAVAAWGPRVARDWRPLVNPVSALVRAAASQRGVCGSAGGQPTATPATVTPAGAASAAARGCRR